MDINLLNELLNKNSYEVCFNRKNFFECIEYAIEKSDCCNENIEHFINTKPSALDCINNPEPYLYIAETVLSFESKGIMESFFSSLMTINYKKSIDAVEVLKNIHDKAISVKTFFVNYFYAFSTKDADVNKGFKNAFFIIEHSNLRKTKNCKQWIYENERIIEDIQFRLNNYYDSYCNAMKCLNKNYLSKNDLKNCLIDPMEQLLIIAKLLEPYDENKEEEIIIDIFDDDNKKVDYAIIDKCDINKVNQYVWYKDKDDTVFYTIDDIGERIYLANVIMEISDGDYFAGYITKDTRDNRRSNLGRYETDSYNKGYDNGYKAGYEEALKDIERKNTINSMNKISIQRGK